MVSKKLVWKNLVGQKRIRETLTAAFDNGSLGHAYLFSGPAGVGKFQTALELASALLCTGEGEVPCYACESCRQIKHFSHPDFHLVFPVILEREHKSSGDSGGLSEEGWQYIGDQARKKIENPYGLSDSRMSTIPVDWVRELNHSIMRGATQGLVNVAIICDPDIMQPASANAMLKTLEEPPPHTILFLLTERPQAVLPTIRSRCQIVRFGSISAEDISNALCRDSGLSRDDERITYAVTGSGGSYGKACSLMDESLDIFARQAAALWNLCVQQASLYTISCSLEQISEEYLGGGYDYAASEKLFMAFLHIIRSTFFASIGGTEKYITGASGAEPPIAVGVETVELASRQCEKALSDVRARGNGTLILLTFLLSLMEILHGKK